MHCNAMAFHNMNLQGLKHYMYNVVQSHYAVHVTPRQLHCSGEIEESVEQVVRVSIRRIKHHQVRKDDSYKVSIHKIALLW